MKAAERVITDLRTGGAYKHDAHLLQLTLTGRFVKRFGLGVALAVSVADVVPNAVGLAHAAGDQAQQAGHGEAAHAGSQVLVAALALAAFALQPHEQAHAQGSGHADQRPIDPGRRGQGKNRPP